MKQESQSNGGSQASSAEEPAQRSSSGRPQPGARGKLEGAAAGQNTEDIINSSIEYMAQRKRGNEKFIDI